MNKTLFAVVALVLVAGGAFFVLRSRGMFGAPATVPTYGGYQQMPAYQYQQQAPPPPAAPPRSDPAPRQAGNSVSDIINSIGSTAKSLGLDKLFGSNPFGV